MGTGNGHSDPQPPQAAAPTRPPAPGSPRRDDGVDGIRGPDEVLTFPQLRRLELDELLGQLVEREEFEAAKSEALGGEHDESVREEWRAVSDP